MYSDNDSTEINIPDKEYDSINTVNIQFLEYKKYFISSTNELHQFENCLNEGLESIGKKRQDFNIQKVAKLFLAENENLDLYDFNYLIQWMSNELENSRNYGFAYNSKYSFFGISDKKTLNNIVGKTSEGEAFAFNLVNGQKDTISLIEKSNFKSRYSTKFFNRLVKAAFSRC